MGMLELLFQKYQKPQITAKELSELIDRSEISLARDRAQCKGVGFGKHNLKENGKIYYPLQEVVKYLERNVVKTA